MIVITNPTAIAKEIDIIHALFENGLGLMHIRKPAFSEKEMKDFLSKIKVDYCRKLVLHNHHQLAEDFGINRFHLTQKNRLEIDPETLYVFNEKGILLSTSTHDITDFNSLRIFFGYAFLSPVFPSISKVNYQSEINLIETIKYRTNFATQLIALGGLNSDNLKKTIEYGFDNVALLGAIWNNNNPLENYILCQKIDLSF